MYTNNENQNNQGDTNMDFKFIKEYLQKDKIKMVNPSRRKDLMEAYDIIQNLFAEEETTIEIEPDKLELGDISIRITALSITTFDLNNLIRALQKADSVDIYPQTDDTVILDIQFNDVYSVYITN